MRLDSNWTTALYKSFTYLLTSFGSYSVNIQWFTDCSVVVLGAI